MNKVSLVVFLSFCAVLRWQFPAASQPVAAAFPVIKLQGPAAESASCVSYDPVKHKVYLGTLSKDPQRRGLLVYDNDGKGGVVGLSLIHI